MKRFKIIFFDYFFLIKNSKKYVFMRKRIIGLKKVKVEP